jgi:hypothetical protein
MRHASFTSSFPVALILLLLLHIPHASAQAGISGVFTTNLSLGSSGTLVATLQQMLNRDADTRVASSGPGSSGNETPYFGSLTKAAVVRFQEKYANEILTPVGLAQGNGYVGLYTRAKLNTLSALTTAASDEDTDASGVQSVTTSVAPSIPIAIPAVENYLVTDEERIDIYAGDAMLANVRDKIYTAINSAIVAQSTETITLPAVTLADVPSVAIGELSPRFGVSGARVSITGTGVSSNSVVYFGSTYLVRAVNRDSFGNFSFIIPPIPPARYDVAIKTGESISNTATLVITNPQNPLVHIQSVSPSTIPYGGTLMITGSGFSPQGNVVVTTYQKFTNVSSPDGKTLTVQPTPASLQGSARVGDGTRNVPMYLYVVNDYGFSNSGKSFTMTI